MSDSLASTSTLEATPQDGQSQRASDLQPQGETSGQPPQNGQVVKAEDFKNLQRKLSEKDLQAKQALTEAQRANTLAQQLRQRLEQLEDASAPGDYERMELRVKRAEETAQQYAAAYQQQLQAQQEAQARDNALREVADEFGVSVKDLEEATDYKSAVKLAVKAQQDKEQRKQTDNNDKRERNAVDIGGGAARTQDSEWDRQWAEAVTAKDSAAQARLLRTGRK